MTGTVAITMAVFAGDTPEPVRFTNKAEFWAKTVSPLIDALQRAVSTEAGSNGRGT